MTSAPHLAAAPLTPLLYEPCVRHALREDLGDAGDVTTNALVDGGQRMRAAVVTRGAGVVAGLDAALFAFRALDPGIEIHVAAPDGTSVAAQADVALVEGSARAILGAERTALNFLAHLSGVATLTAAYVRAAVAHSAIIVDTRKTTPGLRGLEKYAVRVGGGRNHRFGLYDAVLIKDNHVALCGGVAAAVKATRLGVGHLVKVEVEVDSLAQLEEALTAQADAVLLDNMSLEEMRAAVRMNARRALLEASGSVSLERVADIAATGVDLISVGALTHSARALDVGLDVR